MPTPTARTLHAIVKSYTESEYPSVSFGAHASIERGRVVVRWGSDFIIEFGADAQDTDAAIAALDEYADARGF